MHYLMFAVVMVKALSNLFNAVSIKVRNDTKKKKKKIKANEIFFEKLSSAVHILFTFR